MNNYETYFLLFIIYAFLGWLIEVIHEVITTGKLVNRGFLIGPYCPIYGFGGLFIKLFISKYSDDPIVMFVLAIFACSILEYFTSYIMEKLFNARWWDYSNRKFNINGRICLGTMIPFGALCLFSVYILNPFLFSLFDKMDTTIKYISYIIFIIFVTDIFVSTFILKSIKDDIKKIDLDNTEEISKKVKESIPKLSWIKRRIVLAFPDAKYIKEKIKNNIDFVITKERKKQEKIRIETEAEIKKIKLESDYKIQKIKEKAEDKIKKLNKTKEK